METITLEIDGKDRDFKLLDNEDLTVKDWFDIYNKYNEPEYKEVEMANGEFDKVEIPKEEWSDEFIWNKQIELCLLFCSIPRRFYDEYLGITEFVLNLMPSLEYDKVVKESITLDSITYESIDLATITLQQWADIESVGRLDRLAPVTLYFQDKGKTYDRFNRDLQSKLDGFYGLNAKEYMETIFTVYRNYDDLRKSFHYVYNADYGNHKTKSPNANKHYELFGWLDTVVSVAETGLFGNIYETRNALAIDVLDYLNIKRSKDSAESRDYLLNNKPIK